MTNEKGLMERRKERGASEEFPVARRPRRSTTWPMPVFNPKLEWLRQKRSGRARPNLYLVGFMGTGKSTMGRGAAAALGFQFIDSDKEIEKAQNRSIKDIFATDGEAAFRVMERQFIETGHPESGCVVSTGGGLSVQPGMVDLLRAKGVVIGLFASIETILERTARNDKRPLLNTDDREARVRDLLALREPIYRSAGPSITSDHRDIREVVSHVVRVYRQEAERWRPPEAPAKAASEPDSAP